ncbi:cyclin pho80-like protein [Paraburkholderia caribensis MBA4]|uniref:Cyclin pho80-like protein n=1 Tax=Paraburkholderia caribensis MBA4 TaxID=1323664 RepID=A0A0P0RCU4_9BURK|nr:hypothetical protein [Paraburkholderia caribensis]ALL66368.1 cyclin pho80-like protein [Paraburkholderia caribensis MBA4]
MKNGEHVRLWTVLTRVRQIRVERKRRLLNEARIEVERAAADAERKRATIALHDERRVEILLACRFPDRTASLWRTALHRHDARKIELEDALAAAVHVKQLTEAEVVYASGALQREMYGESDARKRSRRLKLLQKDSGTEV